MMRRTAIGLILSVLLCCVAPQQYLSATIINSYRFSSAPSPLLTNLVSYWKLGEASGTRNDSHGTNHLTDVNTVTQAVGKVGNAGQFTAANEELLSLVDNASISAGDIDFSVAAWIYLDTKSANREIASHYYSSGGDRSWRLCYELSYLNPDRIVLYLSSDGTYSEGVTAIQLPANSFGSPPTATWIFVVAWHDATANTASIQINNGTVDSVAWTAGVYDPTGNFEIGGNSGADVYMNGRIDEVMFAKRVWTAGERTQLYNSGNGVTYPSF